MTFDLCVPAHNEAEIIEESLRRICAELEKSEVNEWRIYVSDNASTDETHAIVEAFNHPRVLVLRTEEKGKGAAITAAAQESTGAHFGFIDADLSAHPENIHPLFRLVLEDEADIVIGSRLLNTELVQRSALRSLSSQAFNALRHTMLGIKVADSQCGLKLMNAKGRDVLRRCTETGWFLDMEFLARAERAGLRIAEVPVSWNEYAFGDRPSKLKVVRDGMGAVQAMRRIRKQLAQAEVY